MVKLVHLTVFLFCFLRLTAPDPSFGEVFNHIHGPGTIKQPPIRGDEKLWGKGKNDLKQQSHHKTIFPANSVEVWSVSKQTLKKLETILVQWIIIGKGYGNVSVFPESVRINEMLLETIREYLAAKPEDLGDQEITPQSLFLVAKTQGDIHGIALLGGDEKQKYTRKIEYLTVAPSDLDPKIQDHSYRYVGSSIVEKSLELSDTITLEPANKSSAIAYQKMGFITLKVDESNAEDLGVGALFGNSADKLKLKLASLRSPKESLIPPQ